MQAFLKAISNLGASVGDMSGKGLVDREVFLSLADKVAVGDGLKFILRGGTEWIV